MSISEPISLEDAVVKKADQPDETADTAVVAQVGEVLPDAPEERNISRLKDETKVHVIVMGPVLGASVGDVLELSAAEARQYAGYVMPIASPGG